MQDTTPQETVTPENLRFSSKTRKESARLTSLSSKLNKRRSDIVTRSSSEPIPDVPALPSSLEAKAASDVLFGNTVKGASHDDHEYDDVSIHEGFANLITLRKPGTAPGFKPVDLINLSRARSMPMMKGKAKAVHNKSPGSSPSNSPSTASSRLVMSTCAGTTSPSASTDPSRNATTHSLSSPPAPLAILKPMYPSPPPSPLELDSPVPPILPKRTRGPRPRPVTEVSGLETLVFEPSTKTLTPLPLAPSPPANKSPKSPRTPFLSKMTSKVFHCRKTPTRPIISAPAQVYLGTGIDDAPVRDIVDGAPELAAAVRDTRKTPVSAESWVATAGKGTPVKRHRAASLRENDKGHPHPLRSAAV
ncbi:hypothetical protein MBLNU230_g5424t1 [Neophaeotheca triangularis]